MQERIHGIVASAICCIALGTSAAQAANPLAPQEIPPPRLGYTAFFVENVPKTVAFYTAAFGISLKYMHSSEGYAELNTGATTLAFISEAFIKEHHLLADSKLRTNRARLDPVGAEIAFVSQNIDRDWSRAVRAGAKVVKAPEAKPWGQTTGFLLDLNGVIVELCTPSVRE
jgi:uncharacterized glyoxalase superfamily protein PhnB